MRDELRLTLLVEFLPGDGESIPIVREQATCRDVLGLARELDDEGLAASRFRAAIAETFLNGSRDLDGLPGSARAIHAGREC